MNTGATLHLGVAEQGKVHALAGEHGEALRHYREALRMAIQAGDADVFSRHYTQCVLESLEHMGSWAEILAFCERAESWYAEHPPEHELACADYAAVLQRKGVVLLKAGRADEALAALQAAVARVPRGQLPLADGLIGWLRRRYLVQPKRLAHEQDRHRYFVVRADNVDPSRAIPLPEGIGPRP
ncbi:MAG: peptidylprolyl isomerase [Alphaproteobacteria bacterium]|nr:peptidylprolyl isomerase [Alphaproteobacteria bacterium]